MAIHRAQYFKKPVGFVRFRLADALVKGLYLPPRDRTGVPRFPTGRDVAFEPSLGRSPRLELLGLDVPLKIGADQIAERLPSRSGTARLKRIATVPNLDPMLAGAVARLSQGNVGPGRGRVGLCWLSRCRGVGLARLYVSWLQG